MRPDRWVCPQCGEPIDDPEERDYFLEYDRCYRCEETEEEDDDQ